MDTTLFEKIKEAISKSNSIGVVVGSNPSLDHMAAALSIYLSLKKVNKQAVVASPTEPIVEISSLVGIDKVQSSLGGEAGDLVVSFPYEEGEIDKVSYTLENNFLNIVVKAGEKGLSFSEKDIRYTHGSGNVDLLFIIGTPNISSFGSLLNGDSLRGAKIINIDNKAENQGFGDIVVVSPKASSVSEQVAEVLVEIGISLDKDISQNLLNGMISATDNFKNPNSTALAFEMAGIMMQRGATRVRDESASSFMPRVQAQPQQIQPAFEQRPLEKIQKLEEAERSAHILQRETERTGVTDEKKAPVDWLAPKVYKGGSGGVSKV